MKVSRPADAIAEFLKALGHENHPETEKTPERVEKLWTQNLLSGEASSPTAILEKRIVDHSGVTVILKKIPFHSVCPHHLVPFFGHVDLAYDPDGHIVGLGALENLVACLSRRLILQEDLTGQIVDHLMTTLGAKGAAFKLTVR